MPHKATHKKKGQRVGEPTLQSRMDMALIALVKLLARQAAEQDYKALLIAQEAANDND